MRHNIVNLLSRGIGEREGHGKKGQQEKNSVSEIASNEMEGKNKFLETLSPFSYKFVPIESSIVYLFIK